MALTIVWKLVGSALTLAVAVLVIEEAGSNFQAVVFLIALIGYQRLTWLIAEDKQADRVRYLRMETWFHRLDAAIRGTPPASFAAASMVGKVSDERELEELRNAVEALAKSRSWEFRIVTVTELLLMLAVASVLRQ